MTMRYIFLGALAVAFGLCGCVRTPNVKADAQLHAQAQAAFDAGNTAQARAFIAQANKHYVPRAELWRRTLELRCALAEGTQQGEFRHFLEAWGEQRDDWPETERADAQLTLAECLQPNHALDWLYDLDATRWPVALRTRYNLLFTKLQSGNPAFRDEAVTRWRLAVRGLYQSGAVEAAAKEAERSAELTRSAEAALTAAKLRNELGQEAEKTAALDLAGELSPDDETRLQINLIQTAPLGTKSDF